MSQDHRTPVLIVGGGVGGVAAALAIARLGGKCTLTEPTDWVGGQLTAQGVPPDENRWIEGIGGVTSATRSYLDFRRRVRAWYRAHRPLTPEAAANDRLNPGGGWVSQLCHEPAIGHAVLRQMLDEHIAAGRITLWLHHEPTSAEAAGDRVASVTLRDTRGGGLRTVAADLVLDATELGDLLELAGVEHAIGAEHRDVHGEMHGRPDQSDPLDQQAISWCFAVEHRPGEDHTIDPPASWVFWGGYVPPMVDEPWPGPLLSWTVSGADGGEQHLPLVPWPDEPARGTVELWRYRRIVNRGVYAPGPDAPPDVSLMNCVQMDYFQRPLLGVSPAERAGAEAAAKQQSLCFLYWMQTEAPRHDDPDRRGYPGLRLRGAELGTDDGFAKTPYYREARRLVARTIVTEGHVGAQQREAMGHRPPPEGAAGGMAGMAPGAIPGAGAEPFADSVGIGHYRLDLHPSTAMRNSLYVPTAPFRLPLGALIPVRVRNLLAAGKNIGVTHITNGCYRLHPIEWNAGEAAGVLAVFCAARSAEPAQVHADGRLLREYQAMLADHGVTLSWPWEQEAGLRGAPGPAPAGAG